MSNTDENLALSQDDANRRAPRSPDVLAGFEDLIREHGGQMWLAARRILRDDAEARDAHQDALLSAYAHADQLRDSTSAGAWLNRVASNAALMRRRRLLRRRAHETRAVDLPPEFDVPSSVETDAVDRAVEREELRALVRESVEALPQRHREVVSLHHFEGLGHQPLAARLGLSMSATKVRLHRARQLLRRELTSRHPEQFLSASTRSIGTVRTLRTAKNPLFGNVGGPASVGVADGS